ARAALGDAVAHRRNPARDLCRGAGPAGRGADEFRVVLVRLVRREHVVVGGDDADVRGAAGGQIGLVLPRRRIGMGLVAAAQMRAGWTLVARRAEPVEIGAAQRGRAGADTLRDLQKARVRGHGILLGSGPSVPRLLTVSANGMQACNAPAGPGGGLAADDSGNGRG